MRQIPCACTGCAEQLSKPWLPNLDKTLQLHYIIKHKTCEYSFILCVYNKWYISKLTFKKETKNPDEMESKYELDLQGMNWAAADEVAYNTIGSFQTSDSNTHGYYIIRWTGNSYTLQ